MKKNCLKTAAVAPLGIIGAMALEIEGLRARLTDRETVKGRFDFVRGKLCGREVVTAVCGIGKVSAAACAQALIDRFSPYAVFNIGVAGTLTRALGIGDIALAADTVCHDMDTTALGDPRGYISGLGLVHIPTDGALTGRLADCCRAEGLTVLCGTIASGDRFLVDREEKKEIADLYGAIACEMEGQSICQTCCMNGVPCAVLRSISDSIDGGAMDYERFKELAAERTCRVILRYAGTAEQAE